jgi:hypothetical protein
MDQGHRSRIIDYAMGSYLVVLNAPFFDRLTCVVQVEEQVLPKAVVGYLASLPRRAFKTDAPLVVPWLIDL